MENVSVKRDFSGAWILEKWIKREKEYIKTHQESSIARKEKTMGEHIRAEDWLPEGWRVEIRVRKSGKKDRVNSTLQFPFPFFSFFVQFSGSEFCGTVDFIPNCSNWSGSTCGVFFSLMVCALLHFDILVLLGVLEKIMRA